MAGCIIGGAAGIAGFHETTGGALVNTADGGAGVERVYQGPAANVDAFLAAIPEGTPDLTYSDLRRTESVNANFDSGWAFVILFFAGEKLPGAPVPPFRIEKTLASYSVDISIEPGALIPNTEYDTVTLEYSTLVHSLEYMGASDSDTPSKFEKAQLPANPNDAILIVNSKPAIPLPPNTYLGGGWNKPNDFEPHLTPGTDYKVAYQPIDYRRHKDRGGQWTFSESWAALVLDTRGNP